MTKYFCDPIKIINSTYWRNGYDSFKNEEEKQTGIYRYLWVSEKFYLTGITLFVSMAKQSPQRGLHELDQPMNCVYNDIIRLDFTKFKQVLAEYQVVLREREAEQ